NLCYGFGVGCPGVIVGAPFLGGHDASHRPVVSSLGDLLRAKCETGSRARSRVSVGPWSANPQAWWRTEATVCCSTIGIISDHRPHATAPRCARAARRSGAARQPEPS